MLILHVNKIELCAVCPRACPHLAWLLSDDIGRSGSENTVWGLQFSPSKPENAASYETCRRGGTCTIRILLRRSLPDDGLGTEYGVSDICRVRVSVAQESRKSSTHDLPEHSK